MLKKHRADLENIFDKVRDNLIKKDAFCQAIQNTISEEVELQTGKKQTYDVDEKEEAKEYFNNTLGNIQKKEE